MTDPKAPKKRGRRPRDQEEGAAHYHLGLRYTDAERDQLIALQQFFNAKAAGLGLPPTVTVSSMVKSWINERLQSEMDKWKPTHVSIREMAGSLTARVINGPGPKRVMVYGCPPADRLTLARRTGYEMTTQEYQSLQEAIAAALDAHLEARRADETKLTVDEPEKR